MTDAASGRWRPLATYIETIETPPVRIGVMAHTPDGEIFAYRSDERFFAASTIKLPVVITLLQMVDRGELDPDRKYTTSWRDIYLRDGQGSKLELSEGVDLPLRDLMYLAISMSDNNAANTLIDLAGFDAINDTMIELGMLDSELGRRILGHPALPEDRWTENWTTTADLVTLFEQILSGGACSRINTGLLLHMLSWQENFNRLGRPYLETTYAWGSKTGTVGSDSHDSGFVRTPEGALVLAICTTGLPTMPEAEPVIAEISRLIGVACGLLPA